MSLSCSEPAPTVSSERSSAPFIAGYERFLRDSDNLLAGGRLLFGELGCAACHETNAANLNDERKPAPVLSSVGERVHPDQLRALIADPHGTKPGTTMPDVWSAVDTATRDAEVDALLHFLIAESSGTFRLEATDEVAAERGSQTFNRIGCAACHEPAGVAGDAAPTDPVPLPGMAGRYSLDGMRQFLLDPHAVRPGGRMPGLDLTDAEALDLAHYLLKGTEVPAALRHVLWLGRFDDLAGFEQATPAATGVTDSFDLTLAGRPDRFALRFTGFFEVTRDGDYTFHARVDDQVWLRIDEQLLIAVTSVNRGTRERSGTATLDAGWHRIEVTFAQRRDAAELSLEWEGPGQPRDSITSARLRHSRQPIEDFEPFVVNAEKAARGRELFVERGCLACHRESLPDIAPNPVAIRNPTSGCLAPDPGPAPDYGLDDGQRQALREFLESLPEIVDPEGEANTAAVMTTFNCYACHDRNGVGGVPEDREPYFLANRPDLGEEGRIPPSLDGVGDRLRPDWLARVLDQGAPVRHFMETRMPRFKATEVTELAETWVTLDREETVLPPERDDDRVREAGRRLVGEGGVNCILCHDFNRRPAPTMGLQDLVSTTERLNEDWFVRYLKNPEQYHPGTRMPMFWPFGQSSLPDVLDGDADRQIRAIWTYLSYGERALDPEGLSRQSRELIVGGQPVLYRGKLWEAGWRGIAVGYPGGINLAFDAEQGRLALLWKGAFLDVSRHWDVQGSGLVRPLGDDIRILPHGQAFAELGSSDLPWPVEQGWRTAPYRFLGYDLDARRQPIFRHDVMGVLVHDRFEVAGSSDLLRTMTFQAENASSDLWFRIASGQRIEPAGNDSYLIDGGLTVRIVSEWPEPVIAAGSEKPFELRVPFGIWIGTRNLVLEYSW